MSGTGYNDSASLPQLDIDVERDEKAGRADKAALDDLRRRAPGVKIAPPPGGRDVDEVVFVGAATRMPCVRRALRALVDPGPDRPDAVDPDTAVAFGAALRAAANDRGAATGEDDFVVVDAYKAEVLRHFASKAAAAAAAAAADEDEDEDEDDGEEWVEVDDDEFARLLALAEDEDADIR